MPPTAKPKPPTVLAELAQLAANLKAVPYEDLAEALAEAGWISLLAQTDVTTTPSGTVLVTFDVMVGKSYDTLERLDSLTMSVSPGPGPVSVAARVLARESVLFMLTGRLPPSRQIADAPEPRTGQMNGGGPRQVDVSGDGDVVLDDAEDEPVSDLRVVERREPDGLPIFRDLYDIGPDEASNTGEVIAAVMGEIDTFLASASAEQVDALPVKNPDLLTFIKDLGRPDDTARLRKMVEARKAALAAAGSPRRRVSALQRAN
jgi:hypothetical protein